MDDGVRWAREGPASAGDVFLSSVLQEAAGNRAIGRTDRAANEGKGTGRQEHQGETKRKTWSCSPAPRMVFG